MTKIIGIIGGKGLMGSFFAEIFKHKGFRVLISDVNTGLTNRKLVQKSDIVFFSVPIHLTPKMIKSVLPYTRPDQLLLDCTSLKTIPMAEMMKSKASVIGLHPMFRPSPIGLKNQTIVMCVGRAKKEQIQMVKNWFLSGGAKIIEMMPKKHDRLMSIIQVLLHFHTIVLGNTMKRLGVPIRETLATASPIYKLEMDMIGRIFSQNPLLYGAIEMFNPETTRVTQALLKETQRLAKIVLKKKLKNFANEFNKTSKFLGNFKDEALEEINCLLTHLK